MKQVSTFNLDKDVIESLSKYHQEGIVNKSKLVNKLIKDFLIKEGYYKEEINKKINL